MWGLSEVAQRLQQNDVYVYWLVVSTPLKNMSSSVGITIPNIWKNMKKIKNVPNHQSVYMFQVARLITP
jgi:hypothetical protein